MRPGCRLLCTIFIGVRIAIALPNFTDDFFFGQTAAEQLSEGLDPIDEGERRFTGKLCFFLHHRFFDRRDEMIPDHPVTARQDTHTVSQRDAVVLAVKTLCHYRLISDGLDTLIEVRLTRSSVRLQIVTEC